MAWFDKLLTFLYKRVRIKKSDLIAMMDACDADRDGYITAPEVWAMVKRLG